MHTSVKSDGRIGPFSIREVDCPADLDGGRHFHANPRLIFLTKGSFSDRTPAGRRDCPSLSMLYRAAGEIHETSYGPSGVRYIGVEVTGNWDAMRHLPIDSTICAGPEIIRAVRTIKKELRYPDHLSGLTVESAIANVIVGIARKTVRPGSEPSWLAEIDELIRSSYTKGVTLDQLANSIDIHPVHVSRTYHRFRGRTITDEIRRLRIEHAARGLAEDKKSIGAISLDAGFSEQSHFARLFRAEMGQTPREFRRSRSTLRSS